MILVTGGAGYIGSHTVKELLRHGYEVVVYDNLSTGHREFVLSEHFVEGDLLDLEELRATFRRYPIEAVLHFAAVCRVDESVANPQKYYQNNVVGGLNLLQAMLEHDVKLIIFSSSAAVYGDPELVPIPENHPKRPKNPYGWTKWIFEQILADYAHAYGLKYIALRYFNAAGADPEGQLGERRAQESHLIPIVLEAALRGKPVQIYGTDYNTDDGTAIRDYIHVSDLATAHVLALQRLQAGQVANGVYNLGIGRGYSVREVIETCERVTGRRIEARPAPRRPGDPARLVADATRARRELGWEPQFTELEEIVRTAWEWMKRQA